MSLPLHLTPLSVSHRKKVPRKARERKNKEKPRKTSGIVVVTVLRGVFESSWVVGAGYLMQSPSRYGLKRMTKTWPDYLLHRDLLLPP